MTRPGTDRLPPGVRAEAGFELQAVVVDLVDLALCASQLQWAVEPGSARELIAVTDRLSAEWRTSCNLVAERAIALGRVPSVQSRVVAVESRVDPLPTAIHSREEALGALVARVAVVEEHVADAELALREVDGETAALLAALRSRLQDERCELEARL